jgi:hypothetical protein
MIDAMQSMSGPIRTRQRAIVPVLRAGVEASIVRVSIIGLLRAFDRHPRAYYTRRQLAHSRPVIGPLRPLIDTRRHCARRQPGPIGENSLLMTLCPPNIIPRYISYYYVILEYIVHNYIIPKYNIQYYKVCISGSILYACATPPYPKNLDLVFSVADLAVFL